MNWTPSAELERLVDIAGTDRRERFTATVQREGKELDAQLAARGTFLSGGRITGHQDIRARHFETCALGTIDDVLTLVRDLHGGEVPLEAAPWLRERLLSWVSAWADGIADQVFAIAQKLKANVTKDRFYPRAEMAQAERRIELELGKLAYKAGLRKLTPPESPAAQSASGADVFVSHASEDKDDVARPLAAMIRDAGLSVWLDETELTLGDRLLDKIDEGIANCRFGVVILSPNFFAKKWTRRELAGLAAREDAEDRKVILPVWHSLGQADVTAHSPLLAGVLGVSTSNGLQPVVEAILRVVKPG